MNPKYNWEWGIGDDTPQSADTKAYTSAFWDFFANRYPDANPASDSDVLSKPLSTKQHLDLTAWAKTKGTAESRPVGGQSYERTVFGLMAGKDTEVGFPFPKIPAGHPDYTGVNVYQPKSYTKDTGDALDLAGCDNHANNTQFDSCNAEKHTGPRGEDLRYASMLTHDDGQRSSVSARYVVWYRTDGSAVVISDENERMRPSDPAPALSFRELAEVALAMPDNPVH